jgi:cytochrome c
MNRAIVIAGMVFMAYVSSLAVLAQSTGRTIWTSPGIYTGDQAARGKKSYMDHCSECHLESLKGDGGDVPALVGEEFLKAWDGKSVNELFTRMRETMPQDSPSSLPAQTYLDLVAYVFQTNGAPEGPQELALNSDALKASITRAR